MTGFEEVRQKCGTVYTWNCAGELYGIECELCEERPLCTLNEFAEHMELWHSDWQQTNAEDDLMQEVLAEEQSTGSEVNELKQQLVQELNALDTIEVATKVTVAATLTPTPVPTLSSTPTHSSQTPLVQQEQAQLPRLLDDTPPIGGQQQRTQCDVIDSSVNIVDTPKLTTEHVAHLIELYRRETRLWNQAHSEFRNMELGRESWRQITEAWSAHCGRLFSVTDVRIRISTLCQRFLKQRERLHAEGELEDSAKFVHYDQLKFLCEQQSLLKRQQHFARENRKLLEIYEHYPILWHNAHKRLRCVDTMRKRHEAQRNLQLALRMCDINLSGLAMQRRLQSLRKRYRLEKIRYLHSVVEGKQSEFISTFEHYAEMEFLHKHIDPYVCAVCGKIFENLVAHQAHVQSSCEAQSRVLVQQSMPVSEATVGELMVQLEQQEMGVEADWMAQKEVGNGSSEEQLGKVTHNQGMEMFLQEERLEGTDLDVEHVEKSGVQSNGLEENELEANFVEHNGEHNEGGLIEEDQVEEYHMGENQVNGNLVEGNYVDGSLADMNYIAGNHVGASHDEATYAGETNVVENHMEANYSEGTHVASNHIIVKYVEGNHVTESHDGGVGSYLSENYVEESPIGGSCIGRDHIEIKYVEGNHIAETYVGDNHVGSTYVEENLTGGNYVAGNHVEGTYILGHQVEGNIVEGNQLREEENDVGGIHVERDHLAVTYVEGHQVEGNFIAVNLIEPICEAENHVGESHLERNIVGNTYYGESQVEGNFNSGNLGNTYIEEHDVEGNHAEGHHNGNDQPLEATANEQQQLESGCFTADCVENLIKNAPVQPCHAQENQVDKDYPQEAAPDSHIPSLCSSESQLNANPAENAPSEPEPQMITPLHSLAEACAAAELDEQLPNSTSQNPNPEEFCTGTSPPRVGKLRVRLTLQQTNKLIELYQAHPNLWDPNHLDYHGRKQRRQTWHKIAGQLNEYSEVKRDYKWQMLHRKLTDYTKYYRRERQREALAEEGKAEGSRWSFYEAFSFLDDVLPISCELQKSLQQRDSNLKIIQVYQSYEQLWCTNHPDYTKRKQRQRQLESLCTRLQEECNLQITVERLKNRLIEFRCQYRQCKLARQMAQKRGEIWQPDYEYYQPLQFLELHVSPFGCNFCATSFKRRTDYLRHQRNVHLEELEQLDEVQGRHLRKRRGRKGVNNTTVVATAVSSSTSNVQSTPNPLEHICHICAMKFSLRTSLLAHLRRHLGQRTHACNECPKKFFNSTALRVHQRSHTKELPYVCEHCARGFVNASKLNQHVKRHVQQRDYPCSRCDKAFYTAHERDRHTRAHLNIRDKVCPYCDRAFVVGSAYYAHLNLHRGEKRYSCANCSQRFAQYAGLYKHRKRCALNAEHPKNSAAKSN